MRAAMVLLVCMTLVLLGVPGFAQEAEPVSSTSSPSGLAGDRSIQVKGVACVGAADPTGLLNIIEGPITIESWVQIDGFNNYWTGLVSWGFTYKMGNAEDAQFLFTFFGIVDIFSGYSLLPFVGDGKWHHLAAVWEPGAGVNFYVDGALEGFVAETGKPRVATSTNFTIGGEDVGKVPFTGKMDRVRIHNAVLTADQLDSNAAAPKAALGQTKVVYGFDETKAPFKSTGSVSLDLYPQNEVVVASSGGWDLYR